MGLLLGLALGQAVGAACAPPPPRRLLVRAGRLDTGSGAAPSRDQRLYVEDGLIVAIDADDGRPIAPKPDLAVLDARQATVVPGRMRRLPGSLHAAAQAGSWLRQRLWLPLAQGRQALDAGVTTAVLLANPPIWGVSLRRYLGVGRSRGPRLMVASTPSALPPRVAVQALLDAGVDAAGWPAPAEPPCDLLQELARVGLPALGLAADPAAPLQPLRCSSGAPVAPTASSQAEALGLGDALGLLRPGYRADLVALAGLADGPPAVDAVAEAVVLDGLVQRPASTPGAALGILGQALWFWLEREHLRGGPALRR